MKNKSLLFIIFFLGYLSLPHHIGLSSELRKSTQLKEKLEHEVTVTLKLVQVYVTDRKGVPITDLEKSDFILYDSGQLKKITDFEKHFLVRSAQAAEEKPLEAQPVPVSEVPSKMDRKFFILIDIYRGGEVGLTKSKKAALHFINTKLQPSDELGVLSFSALKGLTLHSYLTTDHKKIRGIIENLKIMRYKPQEGPTLSDAVAEAEGDAGLEGMGLIESTFVPGFNPEADFAKMTLVNFSQGIQEFAKSLRPIPGYKNIIFFSSGIGNLLYGEDPTFRYRWQEMGKELAASNTPVFAVDSQGTRSHLRQDAVLGEGSLRLLSDLSGGKYLGNIDYYEKIAEEIQNVTSNYYVLGYYIDEKWDGKYREIKVEAKRKGCVVHAQTGYYNPKPFKEYSDIEKLIHLLDLAFGEKSYFQEPFSFRAIALPCSEEKKHNLILLSEIPINEMKEKGVIGEQTEVATLIIDKDRNLVESIKSGLNFLALPHERIYHYTISSLPPGSYEGRVVIRNSETGKGAVASSSIVIPEHPESGILLHQPLILIPNQEARYLKLEKKKDKDAKTVSINTLYPFLSNKHTPVIGELNKAARSLLAGLRCSINKIDNPEIELFASLEQLPSGEKNSLSFSVVSADKKENIELLLIELKLPVLQSGKYSLNFTAKEKRTKLESTVTQTFEVR